MARQSTARTGTEGAASKAAPRWHLSLVWSQLTVDASPTPHADAVRRGVSFADNGLPHRAIDEFRRAINFKPDYGLAYCRLALMFMDSNQPDEALGTYRNLLDHVSAATQPVADALLNTGVILGDLGGRQEAIAVYDDLLTRFNGTRTPALRIRLAEALFNKARMLREMDRHAEAITVLNKLLSRFDNFKQRAEQPPELAVAYAGGIYSKGLALCALGRSQDAVELFEELFLRWQATSFDPPLREPVGPALANVGLIIDAPAHTPMAITAYAMVAGRFRNPPDVPPLNWVSDETGGVEAKLVADALFNKANALEFMPSAVRDYNDIIHYLADEVATPELRYVTAKAIYNKGVVFRELGIAADEIEAYDDLISRFRLTSERALQRLVAKALYNKGCALRADNQYKKAFDTFAECEGFVRHADDVAALRENIKNLSEYISRNGFVERPYTVETLGPARPEPQGLSGTIMDDAAIDLNATADEQGVSREDVLKLIKRAAAEAGSGRAKEKPRPDWIKAHKQGVQVPEFIEKAFAAELADDTMHRGMFDRYQNLRRDFHAYQRHNTLPEWLASIPTKSEWDRQHAEPLEAEELRRIEREAKRARRGIRPIL